MEYKDYYKIMGLKRDATPDQIKKAYHKLARKYHPDVSKEADAETKFKEIGEAYEVLKDPKKRKAYDQLGNNWEAGQTFHRPAGWETKFEFHREFTGDDFGGFSDFFEELFGGTPFHSREGFNSRGQDHYLKITVDLIDAFHGANRSIDLQIPEPGQLRLSHRLLKVKIPKGIKEGQQIRLAGQGAAGVGGGENGDLFLEVSFKPHPLYRPEGRDIHMELPVTPWEAALGSAVVASIPDGKVDLKIPPGSNTGTRLRLKGRGIPGKPSGDVYVTLKIMIPPVDNEQAEALYKKMREHFTYNPRSGM